jgi:uncharacterized membrane protein (Fun14 family)
MMNVENLYSITATIGGGFLTGILVGYGVRQVVKFVAIIVGLFFASLIYLQYRGIAIINWDKLQSMAQSTVSSLTGLITTTGNGNSSTLLPITRLGLPLTGSAAAGFAIGFMKG